MIDFTLRCKPGLEAVDEKASEIAHKHHANDLARVLKVAHNINDRIDRDQNRNGARNQPSQCRSPQPSREALSQARRAE